MAPIILFSSLGGLIVLIWLLALISMMISNRVANEDTNTKNGNDAAAELENHTSHEGFAAIRDAIHSYRRSRESQNREEDKRDKITVVLVGATTIFAFFAAVAAIVSAIIFQRQLTEMRSTGTQTDAIIEANKQLAEAARIQAQAAKDAADTAHENLVAGQRAWIAPITFSLADVNDPKFPLRVQMSYQNVGREPARNIRNYLNYGFIRFPSPPQPFTWNANPAWAAIDNLKPKFMCDHVSPSNNSVAYPSPVAIQQLAINATEDTAIPQAQLVFEEVKSQKTIYFVSGCISYETVNERKNSSFCAVLMPIAGKDITQWPFGACPVGNEDF